MSTDKPAVQDADTEDGETEVEPTSSAERRPSWWHRDHPTFAALSGFFTGLIFVALVPAAFFGLLTLFFDSDRAEELFPFVLVTLVVPIGLVANQRTRRFGTYFWIGMILTAIVVVGVGALVLWYLVEHQN